MLNKNNDIEYEDAYVIEERNIKNVDYDELESEIKEENLTLDSLNLSEDNIEELTNFDKLKLASEITKKKFDDKKSKLTEFRPRVVKREEVVEDYIRNFFTKYDLMNTLEEFNVSFIYFI